VDPHRLDADPDPTFHFDAHPGTKFYTYCMIGEFFSFYSQHARVHWFNFSQRQRPTGFGKFRGFLTQNSFGRFLCLKLFSYFLAITLRTVLGDFSPLFNGVQDRISFNSSWDRDTFLRLNSDL
jgi:hypothetical protein